MAYWEVVVALSVIIMNMEFSDLALERYQPIHQGNRGKEVEVTGIKAEPEVLLFEALEEGDERRRILLKYVLYDNREVPGVSKHVIPRLDAAFEPYVFPAVEAPSVVSTMANDTFCTKKNGYFHRPFYLLSTEIADLPVHTPGAQVHERCVNCRNDVPFLNLLSQSTGVTKIDLIGSLVVYIYFYTYAEGEDPLYVGSYHAVGDVEQEMMLAGDHALLYRGGMHKSRVVGKREEANRSSSLATFSPPC